MPRNFIKAECTECSNQQVIFSRPAQEVKCLVCSSTLAEPTGGSADLEAKIIKQLEVE